MKKEVSYEHFDEVMRNLFYRRTVLCLWLATVFFPLFSFLDYYCCRDYFNQFLLYRLLTVAVAITGLILLRFKPVARHAHLLMYVSLLLGTLSISLMASHLGGFSSGYYVGILLIIAGTVAILPMTASQALFTGFSVYVVYLVTMLFTPSADSALNTTYGFNNTFFFITLIAGTTIQSMDDYRVHRSSFQLQENIKELNNNLTNYTDNLEQLVEERVEKLTASTLKFRDLYENLLDCAVLIDQAGIIQMVNNHSNTLFGTLPETLTNTSLSDYLITDRGEDERIVRDIISQIDSGKNLQALRLKARDSKGDVRDVELSGSRVFMEEASFYQLILRDTSITKKMERQILESEKLIDTSRQAAIFGLAKLAECRDDDTGAHLDRIRLYTKILTVELQDQHNLRQAITHEFTEDIYNSSVLHDIGKVGIPDHILLKPGRLTKEEYDVMKKHCLYGRNTLKQAEKGPESLSFLKMGQDIALYHHEKWDGSGYPIGLSGTAIPLAARIVALADVYDALTTKRVYKKAYSHEYSTQLISKASGSQFDPTIVEAFLRKEREFHKTQRGLQLH